MTGGEMLALCNASGNIILEGIDLLNFMD